MDEIIRFIYDNSIDIGEQVVPWKKQYVRDVLVFKCPFCGKEISSESYLNAYFWEMACRKHLEEEHELVNVR